MTSRHNLPQSSRRFLPPSTSADDIETCRTCDNLKLLNDLNAEQKKLRRAREAAGQTSPEETALPPGLNKIGRSGWTTVHSIAAYYPEEPTLRQKQAALNFLDSLAVLFPCDTCASDFEEYLRDHPPQLESRLQFSQWACDAHNAVNEKLGKPSFPCESALARWRFESEG